MSVGFFSIEQAKDMVEKNSGSKKYRKIFLNLFIDMWRKVFIGSDHFISTDFKKILWGTISDFPNFYISLSTLCK